MTVESKNFTQQVVRWFQKHGRQDLPWQLDPIPYRVWVSEIMLQQTRVNTVIPYFIRFTKRFPDIGTLAAADLDEVLHCWTGLGYYARGRNLHCTAKIIAHEYDGRFPTDFDTLVSLPGIGRSTAGAILALACDERHPILDGNVKRVLTRFHAVSGWPGTTEVERQLWILAERYTPYDNVAQYTQAIMDLGAMICIRRNPHCDKCPVSKECIARIQANQHKFPTPKPRKTLPVRKTVFAILENDQGEILLEQRIPQRRVGRPVGIPGMFSKGRYSALG
jgi:A/G-specific adenine glycosylase